MAPDKGPIHRDALAVLDLTDIVDPDAASNPPPHPGTVLMEDWLRPRGLTPSALAKAIVVPPNRMTETVKGRRDITADTALRLARVFGTDAQSWLTLQTAHSQARTSTTLAETPARIRPLAA